MTNELAPLALGEIAATNVVPAYEVSLAYGATEIELERATGLTRAHLQSPGASVTAEATYLHMELMFDKPGFGGFVLAATRTHTLSSLGVVGLACKTVSTVGEAMACHHRFQHLTNRTAEYASATEGERFVLRETRHGEPRLGSLLVSDYAMLIAVQLIRASFGGDFEVLEMHSRRAQMEPAERDEYEEFLGAPIRFGSARAELWFDKSLLARTVPSADAEMAGYFRELLLRAAKFADDEDPLLRRARLAIQDALVTGTPSAGDIARGLGLGQRTLQRRLADLGLTFTELLDSTRSALAEGYLRDPSVSLAEIAYLLGYREQASFFRAFRKWRGQTPAAFRREGR